MLLVHTDDSYGSEGAAAVEAYGRVKSICFSKINISTEPSKEASYYQDLAKRVIDHSANGIIYFGQENPGKHYLMVEPYMPLYFEIVIQMWISKKFIYEQSLLYAALELNELII